MRIIGFHGGSSMCELGPVMDVVLFFECLDIYVAQVHPEKDWGLLTDRLYRRYLRIEELDRASELMNEARNIFTTLHSSSIKWQTDMEGEITQTWLNSSASSLAEVFAKYFENFSHCVESAKLFFDSWNIYQPVRTGTTDIPYFIVDKNRPFEDYETIEGDPFWLR
jgi:hypothetical protein